MRAAGAVLLLTVAGCDLNGAFLDYCHETGSCQCDSNGCCSVTTCGDDGLECCAGTACVQGQCVQQAATMQFSPGTVEFGRFPNLTQSPVVSVQLTNTGTADGATATAVTVTSGETSEFSIDTSACPTHLAAGASCTVKVQLTPATLGAKAASVKTEGSSGAPLQLSGVFGILVQVNFLGTQTTAVVSSPPGLVCTGSGCSAYFPAGTEVSLSVALPYGVTWGAPCPLPAGVCTLTLSSDTQVAATIQAPLVVDVTLPGVPTGYVQIDPGAIQCQGHCEVDVSGAVTLTALAINPIYSVGATVFQGWTGACAGSGAVCTLDVTSPTTTGLTLSDLNLAFITGPVSLSSLGSDGAGADLACNSSAPAGDGNFVAWVATSSRNPALLLAAATGWAPAPPSSPTALSLGDLTSARLWTPIGCPSCSDPPGYSIVTGANPDGTALSAADTCQDWTSSTGTAPVGTVGGMGYGWSVDLGATPVNCNGSAYIACFGAATAGLVLTVPPAAFFQDSGGYGLMFLSSPWIPSNGTAGGDAHCQADAVAAGLSGTFVAGSLEGVLGNGQVDSVFSEFVRTDGAYAASGFQYPNNVDAFGRGVVPATLSDSYLWAPNGSDQDCNEWTGGPGSVGGVLRFDVVVHFGLPPVNCTEAHRLYCYQSK